MPRNLRVFVEGGIYHVYNRFASGEPVFADPEEVLEFIELLRYVKQRDGWTIFASVLMSNHFHLAIRSWAIPISTTPPGPGAATDHHPGTGALGTENQ